MTISLRFGHNLGGADIPVCLEIASAGMYSSLPSDLNTPSNGSRGWEWHMRILEFDAHPFHSLHYSLTASARGPSQVLGFYRAAIDVLPSDLDAIVVTGDLQGIELGDGESNRARLLGEVVASEIGILQMQSRLPPKGKTAVLLAGDFQPWADEDDVLPVWTALGAVGRWVAGVAGNHDRFGQCVDSQEARMMMEGRSLYLLDQTRIDLDGLRLGGISGMIGNSNGLLSRNEAAFASAVAQLVSQPLDILIMHDGPNVAGTDLAGWPAVRHVLEGAAPMLVVRGHDQWPIPLAELSNESQVLNVEERVVVLSRKE